MEASSVKSLTQEHFNFLFDRVISYVLNGWLVAVLLITGMAS